MVESYRALIVSDVHLSNRLPHARTLPGSDVTDRFQCQLNLMDGIAERADQEKIQDIFIPGDLFDKPVLDTVTLREATGCLMRMASDGRRVFIGAGNHEASTVRGGTYVSEFIQHLGPNVIYMDHGWTLNPVPWLRLWWTPWAPLLDAQEALDAIIVKAHHARIARQKEHGDEGQDVLLMHQSVNGCTAGGWKCDDGLDPMDITKHFDTVISGHFHDPQEFGTCGMYLGSPLQLHFGDVDGERVYWDMTFKKGEDVLAVPCETAHPKFHQREVDGPKGITEGAPAGDYIRYVVKCAPELWTKNRTAIDEAVKRVSEGGCHAKAVHRPIPTGRARLSDDSAVMAYEEMLAEYVKVAAPEGLDTSRLQEIGQAALEASRAASTTAEE